MVGQSVAGGNVSRHHDDERHDHVINNQYNKSTTIDSTINAGVGNIGGSVGYTSQAVCNSAGVSTDPTMTAVNSNQECHSIDPSSTINANIANIGGDVGLASSSVGNTFEADSNASNMPVSTNQINSSFVHSNVNANLSNVGGSVGATSSGDRQQRPDHPLLDDQLTPETDRAGILRGQQRMPSWGRAEEPSLLFCTAQSDREAEWRKIGTARAVERKARPAPRRSRRNA